MKSVNRASEQCLRKSTECSPEHVQLPQARAITNAQKKSAQ
ncbi:hypothetical protein CCACVL1_02253 [Corchorus capsularis]|uniref:Uncharacterized protein n=1 Tax=Corchorus capsularis TaxID=210143 RepID=A0A1R3K9S8_COCAP|nr:hypothetical protein CCACVL1_02253 [Corchorus capsularis]